MEAVRIGDNIARRQLLIEAVEQYVVTRMNVEGIRCEIFRTQVVRNFRKIISNNFGLQLLQLIYEQGILGETDILERVLNYIIVLSGIKIDAENIPSGNGLVSTQVEGVRLDYETRRILSASSAWPQLSDARSLRPMWGVPERRSAVEREDGKVQYGGKTNPTNVRDQ
jgi:hypothetical protein